MTRNLPLWRGRGGADGRLDIRGPARIHPWADIESLGDHRVAMAMTVLALYSDAPVRINDTAWIATSYPTFWDDLNKVGGHAEQHRGN